MRTFLPPSWPRIPEEGSRRMKWAGSHRHWPSLGIQAEWANEYYTCYWRDALVSEEAQVPWWWAKLQSSEGTGLYAVSRNIVCFEGSLVSSRGNRNEEDKAEVSQRKSGCKMTKQCCCERIRYCSNSPHGYAPTYSQLTSSRYWQPKLQTVGVKCPWLSWLFLWHREVSLELWGNPGMSELRHYQMKIHLVKTEKQIGEVISVMLSGYTWNHLQWLQYPSPSHCSTQQKYSNPGE